jgi:hypothetical protein
LTYLHTSRGLSVSIPYRTDAVPRRCAQIDDSLCCEYRPGPTEPPRTSLAPLDELFQPFLPFRRDARPIKGEEIDQVCGHLFVYGARRLGAIPVDFAVRGADGRLFQVFVHRGERICGRASLVVLSRLEESQDLFVRNHWHGGRCLPLVFPEVGEVTQAQ